MSLVERVAEALGPFTGDYDDIEAAQAALEALGFVTCQTCDGEGNYPPLTRQVCPTCHGRKVVPSDTMTEQATEAMLDWIERRGVPDKYAARAALLAAIGGDK